jgi:hypothetical protein
MVTVNVNQMHLSPKRTLILGIDSKRFSQKATTARTVEPNEQSGISLKL